MKWYKVELEIPIYGKNFETIHATDKESAIKNTIDQYYVSEESIKIIIVREINT